MIGGFDFKLKASKAVYDFTLNKKYTIIQGDSASGKSMLVEKIQQSEDPSLGIAIRCGYKTLNITDAYTPVLHNKIMNLNKRYRNRDSIEYAEAVRNILDIYDNALYFCDEAFRYLGTKGFATFCKYTDSFFIIMCRDRLVHLSEDDKEICTLKSNGKAHYLERVE